MTLTALFHTAWNVFRRNRLIWLFAGIVFAFSLLDRLLPRSPSLWLSLVRYLVVGLAAIYAEAGTILSANASLAEQPLSLGATNRLFLSRLARILFLYILPVVLFWLLPSLIVTALVMAQPTPDPANAIDNTVLIQVTGLEVGSLAMTALYAILYPFFLYCLGGILIHNAALVPGVRRGWKLFTRNLAASLSISLIFLGTWVILRLLAPLAALALGSARTMSSLVGSDAWVGLLFLLLSPTAELAVTVLFCLLFDPLKRIMLTQVYLRALGEQPAPVETRAKVPTPV